MSDSRKRETPYRGKADGAFRKRLSEGVGGKEGRKRFLAALEMTAWGMAIPYIIQRMCGKRVLPVSSSRAESRGLFRWRQEGERLTARNGKHPYHGKWKRRVSRIVIPSEVEGSFSLAVRRSAFDSEERETPCRGKAGAVLPVNGLAKKSGKKGTKKISRCARNDGIKQAVCHGNKKRGCEIIAP